MKWSIKKMIRLIVTSATFRRESRSREGVAAKDPDNLMLARFPVRRLEAEAIRDAMLLVAGKLDRKSYGRSEGGGSSRRSIYVSVY